MDLIAMLCIEQLPSVEFVEQLLVAELELLKSLPNVVDFDVPDGQQLTVVGDLHGQFSDVMHIFRCNGLPDEDHPYLFNGDFVDRGDCGVEICLTLFALHQLFPGAMFLNRGNHEERSVHSIYGFKQECFAKLGEPMYELFNSVFAQLPVATILNRSIIVLHGGVDDSVDLEELRSIPRVDYVVNAANQARPGKGQFIHPTMRAKMAEMVAKEQLMRPMNAVLWNDPMENEGAIANKSRGTGMYFGPDVAANFLQRHKLGLIIRSHEQVMEGYDWPFGKGHTCVTVFSASNYAGKTFNRGAFLVFTPQGAASARVAAMEAALGIPPTLSESNSSLSPRNQLVGGDDVAPLAAVDVGVGAEGDGPSEAAAAAAVAAPTLQEPRAEASPAADALADDSGGGRESSVRTLSLNSESTDPDFSFAALRNSVGSEREKSRCKLEAGSSPNSKVVGQPEAACASSASGEDATGQGRYSVAERYNFSFGAVSCVHFHSSEIGTLRSHLRNLHKLRCLIMRRRAELLASYTGDGDGAPLPLKRWAEITSKEIDLPGGTGHHFFEPLLTDEELEKGQVDGAAFVARFTLAQPALVPYYRCYRELFALLCKLDTADKGSVSLRRLGRACAVLRLRKGASADALRPTELLRACGPLGVEAMKSGRLPLERFALLFDVQQAGDQQGSFASVLNHRVDREQLLGLARTWDVHPSPASSIRRRLLGRSRSDTQLESQLQPPSLRTAMTEHSDERRDQGSTNDRKPNSFSGVRAEQEDRLAQLPNLKPDLLKARKSSLSYDEVMKSAVQLELSGNLLVPPLGRGNNDVTRSSKNMLQQSSAPKIRGKSVFPIPTFRRPSAKSASKSYDNFFTTLKKGADTDGETRPTQGSKTFPRDLVQQADDKQASASARRTMSIQAFRQMHQNESEPVDLGVHAEDSDGNGNEDNDSDADSDLTRPASPVPFPFDD